MAALAAVIEVRGSEVQVFYRLLAAPAPAPQHLRSSFEDLQPAFRILLAAYPDYFQPVCFDWPAFVWSAELWYSYGLQVRNLAAS